MKMKTNGNLSFLLLMEFTLLLFCAVITVFLTSRWEDQRQRDLLLLRVISIARSVDSNKIAVLSGNQGDCQKEEYKEIKSLIEKLRIDNQDVKFLYIMSLNREGKLIFLIDSEKSNSKDYTPPGTIYEEGTKEDYEIFKNGLPFVEGPIVDKWGEWISGVAPIKHDGKVVAFVGMDIDSSQWKWNLLFLQIIPFLIAFSLFFLLVNLFFFLYQKSGYKKEISLIKKEKEIVEEKSRAILFAANDFIYSYDLSNRFTEANPSLCKAMRLKREEIIGKTWKELGFTDEIISEWEELHKKVFSQKACIDSETKTLMKDGEIHYYNVSISPIFSNGEITGIAGISHDISERKKIYEQLKQSQKMEAIGNLAAGVAHEFNNILTAILGYAELLKFKLEDLNTETKMADAIFVSGQRAADIVKKLLLFARKESEEKIIVNPVPIIRDVLSLIKATSMKGQDIEVHENYFVEEIYIVSSPTIIHQILMNLCVNAIHAIQDSEKSERGKIIISTFVVENKLENILVENMALGKYFCLELSDNGVGIDDFVRDRIFDPFFTTKTQGRGSGLGLAVIYGLVSSSGGKILIDSRVGCGSTFKVLLPIEQKLSTAKGEKYLNIRGREKILLIDDDDSVADVFNFMLTDLGYTVDLFRDPKLALSKVNDIEIDIIITDMIMPRMNGIDLLKEINKIKKLPAIICSGCGDCDLSEGRKNELGVIKILSKPVQVKELAREIRKYFDKK